VKKILLVEDQHFFISETILKNFGDMAVSVAQRGDLAIEIFAAGAFEGVVLDLRLPVLDGFVVLQALKKIQPLTPVVILSAFGDSKSRQRAISLGADGYFVKPPDYFKLHQTLLELIAQAGQVRLSRTNPFNPHELEQLARYRRLWALRLQIAKYGLAAPVHLTLEVEDLEREINSKE
jgi:DNA-binding response OmpR family regulator